MSPDFITLAQAVDTLANRLAAHVAPGALGLAHLDPLVRVSGYVTFGVRLIAAHIADLPSVERRREVLAKAVELLISNVETVAADEEALAAVEREALAIISKARA